MQLLIEQIINGCALGAVYGLFAIGFGLVFSTLGILNAAHGTYATFAAIAAYYGSTALGLPFALTVLTGVLSGAVLALVVDQLAFQPLRGRGSGMIGALITSIACWMVLDSLAGSATEQQSLSFPVGTYPGAIWYVGSVPLPEMQILAIGLLLAVTVGVHWLLAHSRLGAAMRAVGWNQAAAQIAGVNPRVVIVATAALAGATSGLAGVLGGISTNNVSASLGEGMLLKGFAAVVVGGFSDVRGAAVAGVGLGVAEVLSAQYISSSMRDAITYGLLLGFLVLRPRGLFGAASFVRA